MLMENEREIPSLYLDSLLVVAVVNCCGALAKPYAVLRHRNLGLSKLNH